MARNPLPSFVTMAVLALSALAGPMAVAGNAPSETGAAQTETTVEVRNPAGTSPAFSLVTHDGVPVTEQNFRGKVMLVTFGYTYCPDVCPTALGEISITLDLLGPLARHIAPVFVSFDPERDSAPALKSYLENFHPSIIGLTGTNVQVQGAVATFGVVAVASETTEDGDTLFAHSARRHVIGPDGRYLGFFDHDRTPPEMAASLDGLIRELTAQQKFAETEK